MIPAKNRDRKCSTCRHYQPSPLWRKGWCRNPLLYDRNTNHLVEADSLACNRTFIDYWEPIAGPTPAVGPAARSAKPRIAPSIPIDTTDAKGQRGVVTGNTPAGGMAAMAPEQVPERGVPYVPAEREAPKLSLVTPDYAPPPEPGAPPEAPSKVTRQIEQVPGPASDQIPKTAAQRIKQARARRSPFASFGSGTGRIAIILLVAVLLVGAAGGYYVLRGRNAPALIPVPTAVPTLPAPTPTGFGDATATPVHTATPVLPPAGVIGVNGWVQVQANGGLRVHDSPSAGGARVALLPDGSKAHVVDGPKNAEGFTWWKVDRFDPKNPATSGWVAGKYLVATSAP